ncbi:hypothetical protein [Aminobacter sp. HY435]|uniref:hypothetical protein n=1 Tax=Aminobacter sp. HY435 TaxID=2970917 RepID=UPI0022B98FA8|nr:hypothetical protein [Aminobacter sp. HY435]
MPRPTNYNQERRDRDRAKAAKKADKLAAKAEAKLRGNSASEDDAAPEAETEA